MYWEDDYESSTIEVLEKETDNNLGNWSGLFDSRGNPLVRPKEKIGFKLRKVDGN